MLKNHMLKNQKMRAWGIGFLATLGLVLIAVSLSKRERSAPAARGAVVVEDSSGSASPRPDPDTHVEPVLDGSRRTSVEEEGVSTEGRVTILVLDSRGNAAPGSRVSFHAGQSRGRGLGTTGSEGTLEVQSSSLRRGVLEARHDGFAPAVLELLDSPAGLLELRLGESLSIDGIVSWADGGLPRPGAEVVAFPRSLLPSVVDDESWRGDVLGMHRAAVDDFGAFRIAGLLPDTEYVLAAGQVGWLSTELTTVPSGSTGVQLTVYATYGVRLRLVDAAEGTIRSSEDARRADGLLFRPLDPSVLLPIQSKWSLALSGLDPAELDPRPYEHVFLFASAEDRASLPPVSLHAGIPGYAVREASIPIPRCYGALETVDIELQPNAAEWTTLTLRLPAGTHRPGAPSGVTEPGISVSLKDSKGGLAFLTPRQFDSNGETRMRVPVGAYEYRCKVKDCRGGDSSWREIVLHGPEDLLLLDGLPQAGSFSFDLSDARGIPSWGQAMLYFRQPDSGPLMKIRGFTSSPYTITCFPPGIWEVWAVPGRGAPPQENADATATTVVITAGERTHVQLREP